MLIMGLLQNVLALMWAYEYEYEILNTLVKCGYLLVVLLCFA